MHSMSVASHVSGGLGGRRLCTSYQQSFIVRSLILGKLGCLAYATYSCVWAAIATVAQHTWLQQLETGPNGLVVLVPGLNEGLNGVKELPVEPPSLDAPLGQIIP